MSDRNKLLEDLIYWRTEGTYWRKEAVKAKDLLSSKISEVERLRGECDMLRDEVDRLRYERSRMN